jgi:predicted DNA-binding transcriptional regulator YafY
VTEQYPVEAIERRENGRLRVTLTISARPWLERLLIRLGPDVEVVGGDPALATAGADAARRILVRYEATAP